MKTTGKGAVCGQSTYVIHMVIHVAALGLTVHLSLGVGSMSKGVKMVLIVTVT